MRGQSNARRHLLLATLGVAVLGLGAWYAHTTLGGRTSTPAPADPAQARAGMRVAVQPETGDLVPAPADAPLDAAGLPKPEGDLVIHTLPDGALHANISGHFTSYSVARVDTDGHIQQDCLSDPRAVRDYLQNPPTAPIAPIAGEVK